MNVISGAGGAQTNGTGNGGAGGAMAITGGAGGSSAGGTGGAGASIAIAGGAGGASNGAGGNITLAGGAPNGTGLRGTVTATGLVTTAGTTAVLITGATVLTHADSGGIFTIDQDAAFDIDLPSPTIGAGLKYTFVCHDVGANNVTITVLGGAATFIGTIINDVTSVIPCTGATITLASGSTALGDNIEIISITTGLYFVRAVTSTAGGITIA